MKKTAAAPATETMTSDVNVVDKRVDILVLWDIQGGSPQGDPAQINNRPREDIDTGLGIVTDAGFKRGIRDYVIASRAGVDGYDIHVRHKAVLEDDILQAQTALNLKDKEAVAEDGQRLVRQAICKRFFDVRAFGAVLAHSKKANAGKITGPVQFTHFWSVDPMDIQEIKGTRVAVANKDRSESMDGFNQDFSIKYIVPYALFKGHCFVSPMWAKKTGFTWDDYEVLIEAIKGTHEIRHTSSSGLRTSRRIIAFLHDTHLGCAPASDLFDLVKVTKKDSEKPVRAFSDYEVAIDRERLPAGVTIKEY